jgi:hypothetical protein
MASVSSFVRAHSTANGTWATGVTVGQIGTGLETVPGPTMSGTAPITGNASCFTIFNAFDTGR